MSVLIEDIPSSNNVDITPSDIDSSESRSSSSSSSSPYYEDQHNNTRDRLYDPESRRTRKYKRNSKDLQFAIECAKY